MIEEEEARRLRAREDWVPAGEGGVGRGLSPAEAWDVFFHINDVKESLMMLKCDTSRNKMEKRWKDFVMEAKARAMEDHEEHRV